MNISPLIPLITGTVAAVLFAAVFVGALIVAARNRRIIRRHIGRGSEQ
ncbi:MAG: hypothetical protein HDS72_03935 [Bacteroidales bacterium]|nr:hypothetical protein [Bacteroidales bacterium]